MQPDQDEDNFLETETPQNRIEPIAPTKKIKEKKSEDVSPHGFLTTLFSRSACPETNSVLDTNFTNYSDTLESNQSDTVQVLDTTFTNYSDTLKSNHSDIVQKLEGPLIKFPSRFRRQNLIMVKPGKVGGSTLSGVIRHIGAHHGLSGIRTEKWIQEEPGIFAMHHEMDSGFHKRIKELQKKTFLLTIIRNPIDRCLSDFHFYQYRGELHKPSDFADMPQYFEAFCTNYLLEYISLTKNRDDARRSIKTRRKDLSLLPTAKFSESEIDEVVNMYDFIGLTERFNETMVLLKHILGLKWRDVLYLPAKMSGVNAGVQSYKPYSEESRKLKDFVENKWKQFSLNKDFYLHRKVEQEFERRITMIPSFQEDLAKYELLLDTTMRMCWWVLENSNWEEKNSNCGMQGVGHSYLKGHMQGYQCLDQVGDVDHYFERSKSQRT